MRRSITKESSEVYTLLDQYQEEALKLVDVISKIEKLEEERNKLAIKGQKLKDKMQPLVQELSKDDITEFEQLVNVERGEKEGEIRIDMVDMVEQFKETWRNKGLETVQL